MDRPLEATSLRGSLVKHATKGGKLERILKMLEGSHLLENNNM